MNSLVLILSLLMAGNAWCAAVDPVSQNDPNFIAVLNDDLQKINGQQILMNNSYSASKITDLLGTAHGGTGADFSAVAAESIPYFSATGVMGNIGIGTTGTVLTSRGPVTPPIWSASQGQSNVIFAWSAPYSGGNDANSGYGFYSGSTAFGSITGASGDKAFIYAGQSYQNHAGAPVLPCKWVKISSVSTLTLKGLIYKVGGIHNAQLGLTVGSQSVFVSGASISTWEEVSTTLDVSSLVNGTSYDLTIQLGNDATTGAPGASLLGWVVVLGS